MQVHLDIHWNAKRKCLVSNKKCIKGLTSILKSTFYPSYVWKKVNRPAAAVILGTKQIKRIKGSRRVGNGTDRTITTTVNLQLKLGLDPACFWDLKLAQAHPTRSKQLVAIVKRRNRYVQKFWQLMKVQEVSRGIFCRAVQFRFVPTLTPLILLICLIVIGMRIASTHWNTNCRTSSNTCTWNTS